LSQKCLAIVADTIPYPLRSGDHTRISELIAVLRQKGWCVHLVVTAVADAKSRRLCLEHVDALHYYRGKTPKVRFRNFVRHTARLFDRIGAKLGLPLMEEMVAGLVSKGADIAFRDLWLRYQEGLDDYLNELDQKYCFTAVIVEYIWLYQAKNKLRPCVLKILDSHDLQHLRCKEFASQGERFPLRINRELEAQIFNQFDAVIAIQEEEAKVIGEMCPDKTVLTVGCCTFRRAPFNKHETNVPGRILYVGGYTRPNSNGLRHFMEYSWPEILARQPHVHLRICGNIYRSFLGKSFENAEFLGKVDDVEREYLEAQIVINPVWIGTGLKIKTVEALARGKALVTTSKGIEGMRGNVRESCLVVETAAEFAQAVVAILEADQLVHHYSTLAGKYAEEHLSFDSIYQDLMKYLEGHGR
jgi:glycosyltransferase involved in cell wall biosynthesis